MRGFLQKWITVWVSLFVLVSPVASQPLQEEVFLREMEGLRREIQEVSDRQERHAERFIWQKTAFLWQLVMQQVLISLFCLVWARFAGRSQGLWLLSGLLLGPMALLAVAVLLHRQKEAALPAHAKA